MGKVGRIAKEICDEDYWREIRLELFKEARKALEDNFDIVPYMSDKMFLLRYITEYLKEYKKMTWIKRQTISPEIEALGKYLMIYYDFRDVNLIHQLLYNKRDASVNNLLIEHRQQIERDL